MVDMPARSASQVLFGFVLFCFVLLVYNSQSCLSGCLLPGEAPEQVIEMDDEDDWVFLIRKTGQAGTSCSLCAAPIRTHCGYYQGQVACACLPWPMALVVRTCCLVQTGVW